MRKILLLVPFGVFAIAAASCSRPAPPAPPAPEFRPTATVKDIMDSVVDPSADALWESVSYVATEAGITEKKPRTDDDWKELRRKAITLMEASNMLLVPGRTVARPGEKAADERVEHTPEDIEAMIKADPAAWTKLAHGLYDAAFKNFQAVEAKNVDGVLDAGDALDMACENCHMKYWYRVEPPSGSGSVREGVEKS